MIKLPLRYKEGYRARTSEKATSALAVFERECSAYVNDILLLELLTYIKPCSYEKALEAMYACDDKGLESLMVMRRVLGLLGAGFMTKMIEDGVSNPGLFTAKKVVKLIEKLREPKYFYVDIFEEMLLCNIGYLHLYDKTEQYCDIPNHLSLLDAMNEYVSAAYEDAKEQKEKYAAAFSGKIEDLVSHDLTDSLGILFQGNDFYYLEEYGLAEGIAIGLHKYGERCEEMCLSIFNEIKEYVPHKVRLAISTIADATVEIVDTEEDLEVGDDPASYFEGVFTELGENPNLKGSNVISLAAYRKEKRENH